MDTNFESLPPLKRFRLIQKQQQNQESDEPKSIILPAKKRKEALYPPHLHSESTTASAAAVTAYPLPAKKRVWAFQPDLVYDDKCSLPVDLNASLPAKKRVRDFQPDDRCSLSLDLNVSWPTKKRVRAFRSDLISDDKCLLPLDLNVSWPTKKRVRAFRPDSVSDKCSLPLDLNIEWKPSSLNEKAESKHDSKKTPFLISPKTSVLNQISDSSLETRDQEEVVDDAKHDFKGTPLVTSPKTSILNLISESSLENRDQEEVVDGAKRDSKETHFVIIPNTSVLNQISESGLEKRDQEEVVDDANQDSNETTFVKSSKTSVLNQLSESSLEIRVQEAEEVDDGKLDCKKMSANQSIETPLVDEISESNLETRDQEEEEEEVDDGIMCAICESTDGNETDPIVFCDGCDLMVHATCYGNPLVKNIPEGDWFCAQCLAAKHSQNDTFSCCLCPVKGGALKPTNNGLWAHIVCSVLVPEVFFEDPEGREGIDCSKVPKTRWEKKCYVCKSTKGCAIECSEPKCPYWFHVTCGLNEDLCIEYKEGKKGAVVAGFCKDHSEIWRKQQQTGKFKIVAREEHKK